MHLKSVAVSLKDEAQHIIWTTTLPLPDRPPRFSPLKDTSLRSRAINISRATIKLHRTTTKTSFRQLPAPHNLVLLLLAPSLQFTPPNKRTAQLLHPQDPRSLTNLSQQTTDRLFNTTRHQSLSPSVALLPWSAPTSSTAQLRVSSPSPQSASRPNRNFSACHWLTAANPTPRRSESAAVIPTTPIRGQSVAPDSTCRRSSTRSSTTAATSQSPALSSQSGWRSNKKATSFRNRPTIRPDCTCHLNPTEFN